MSIDDWKKQTLIEMKKFEDKLNNKIKGLNCIMEMTNYHREITKQIEDIIDTIYVDISHIYNFNQMIDDNDIPISHIIKRKNIILNNKSFMYINTNNLDKHFIKFIDIIIKNDGDIHANDNITLRWASMDGYSDIVKCLIKYESDVHARNDESLLLSSRYGHLDVVKCLISNGADIHTCNGWSFIYASINSHFDVSDYLIANGADIHADDDEAFRRASYYGYSDVVEYLKQQNLI
jgi:ankyrin repeat protein